MVVGELPTRSFVSGVALGVVEFLVVAIFGIGIKCLFSYSLEDT